jgi:hypothetical protein
MSTSRASRLSSVLTLVLLVAALVLAASASASSRKLDVTVGTNKTFTRSQLHPGEKVSCHYQGRTLSVAAPSGSELGAGAGWPKSGTKDRSIFTLNVNVTAKRAFNVTCMRGGYHSALVTLP